MAIDSTRISQILPEVKCSKCSASISLDDMTTHTCTILPKLQPISERATNYNGGGDRSQIDRGLFNSANYATPQNAYRGQVDDNRGADLAPNGPTSSKSQHKPSYSNASAVLGRLDSVKTGVLDATGFHRPQQQTRLGPVQLRDPRATIVPIQTNGRHQARDNFAAPSPVHEMPYPQHRMDDTMSVLSDRSGRSARSGWSSNGNLSKPNSSGTDSCFSTSSTDHGPFHHVGTKLDPRIFILDETPATRYTKKSNINAKKGRKPIKDSYDDDWAEQGYDQDTIPHNQPLPRTQFPSRTGNAHYREPPPPPLSPSNNYFQESSSLRESLPRQTYGQPMPSRDPPRQQPQDQANFEDWHSRRQRLEAIRGQKQANSRPGTSESIDSATDPYAHVPSRAHALPPHTRTHTRHETSSSLGTMLTNTTSAVHSARSSTSSPPLSEQNYSNRKFHREDNATPRLPSLSRQGPTPRPGETASEANAGQIPRSDTTESFDRLLQDIGSSIDELDTPKMPFVRQPEASPSSNYSPNLPQPARFVPGSPPAGAAAAAAVMKKLGSPASLRSKETVSSHESGSTQTRQDKRPTQAVSSSSTESRCRACDGSITGRSVSSADGKLSGRYHRACFRCAAPDCPQTRFPDGEFYVFADRPLCAVHYHRAAGSLCPHCGEGVEGACFATADGKKVHPACHVSARF